MLDQSCSSVTVEYTGFSITWNETTSGVTVEAPCTGDNLNGKICNYGLIICKCDIYVCMSILHFLMPYIKSS